MNAGTSAATYRFGHFRTNYVCIDQSVWEAVRVLLLSYRRFRIGSLGISFTDALLGVAMLVRYKTAGASAPALMLPAYGNVAIRVHRGHKVFDLIRATVTKTFTESVTHSEARSQIRACRQASAVSAAPRFLGAGPDDAWYAEELISGVHGIESPRARAGRFMAFYPEVEQCLLELIGSGPSRPVETGAYLGVLTDPRPFVDWHGTDIANAAAAEIRRYQTQISEWLRRADLPGELQLVWCHGDFSLLNVIISDARLRVIDWEGIRHGNVFADCVNFVFVEKYYGRADSDVTREMAEVMQRYGAAVADNYPQLRQEAELPQAVAMRLYYLERLRLLLERQVSANLVSVVRNSIEMFRNFDDAAGFTALGPCAPKHTQP